MSDNQGTRPDEWVDRHGDCLYRYALLRVREPDRAEELVQDTFLEALRARASFAGRSSERTWLVGILKHKVIDHLRKSSRERVRQNGNLHDAPDSPFDERGHWAMTPAGWSGDPARDAEAREFWEVFSGCLAKLPRGLADAFLLRELDGLGPDEVQATLGISPANLWTRLHRARSLLRACLESNWFGRRLSATRAKGASPP